MKNFITTEIRRNFDVDVYEPSMSFKGFTPFEGFISAVWIELPFVGYENSKREVGRILALLEGSVKSITISKEGCIILLNYEFEKKETKINLYHEVQSVSAELFNSLCIEDAYLASEIYKIVFHVW